MSRRLETTVARRTALYEHKLNNRAVWAKLGFNAMTGVVHDDDRQLILAEIDMRKAERMLAIATNANSGNDIISTLAARNMPKLPTVPAIAAFDTVISTSAERVRLVSLITTMDYALRQFRALEVSHYKITDYYEGIRATALAVAYANVASAFFRYAQVWYDWNAVSLTQGSVFAAPVKGESE